MSFELRVQIAIPLSHDALERSRQVAAFEQHINAITTPVGEARGDMKVDVIKTKPRAAKVAG